LASGGDAPEQLPKSTGMPMINVNEMSKQIVIERPALLSVLGKAMLASYIRRKMESDYNRTLLEFLSLYANRLRRWMEQSTNALRNAFTEFADMHRAHFDVAQAAGLSDTLALQNDLRILREWNTADEEPAIQSV
jgi:hypothetical protein